MRESTAKLVRRWARMYARPVKGLRAHELVAGALAWLDADYAAARVMMHAALDARRAAPVVGEPDPDKWSGPSKWEPATQADYQQMKDDRYDDAAGRRKKDAAVMAKSVRELMGSALPEHGVPYERKSRAPKPQRYHGYAQRRTVRAARRTNRRGEPRMSQVLEEVLRTRAREQKQEAAKKDAARGIGR